jgi:hypothetical protein
MRKAVVFFSLLSGLFIFSFQGCTNASDKKETEQPDEKAQYQCPMDCEKGKTYDKPGQCPVCGMDLEKAPVKS